MLSLKLLVDVLFLFWWNGKFLDEKEVLPYAFCFWEYLVSGKILSLKRPKITLNFSAMLLNLNSGCNPPPNDTCYPADNVLECNETMQSAGKAMAFIGKFAVACCFSILYTFSAELYPTCVRSSALGLNSSMARVGGAVSPLMFGLDGSIPWFSNTVFAALAFIGKVATSSTLVQFWKTPELSWESFKIVPTCCFKQPAWPTYNCLRATFLV